MSARTFYELRAVQPNGTTSVYSAGLGVVWAAMVYEGVRSARAAKRHAEKDDGELIPAGARLEVFKIIEELVEFDADRPRMSPIAPVLEEVAS